MRSGVVFLGLFLVAGCGGVADEPDLVAATGSVFVDDKPISGATVTFMVKDAPISTGTTNAEGKFTMTTGGRPGVPLGNAKVGISKTAAATEDMSKMTPEDMKAMQMKSGGATPGISEEIPAKYGNPETSGLSASLEAAGEKNVFEYRLVK